MAGIITVSGEQIVHAGSNNDRNKLTKELKNSESLDPINYELR